MLIELTTKIIAVIPIACAMTKTIPSASELENASELGKQLYNGIGSIFFRFIIFEVYLLSAVLIRKWKITHGVTCHFFSKCMTCSVTQSLCSAVGINGRLSRGSGGQVT